MNIKAKNNWREVGRAEYKLQRIANATFSSFFSILIAEILVDISERRYI